MMRGLILCHPMNGVLDQMKPGTQIHVKKFSEINWWRSCLHTSSHHQLLQIFTISLQMEVQCHCHCLSADGLPLDVIRRSKVPEIGVSSLHTIHLQTSLYPHPSSSSDPSLRILSFHPDPSDTHHVPSTVLVSELTIWWDWMTWKAQGDYKTTSFTSFTSLFNTSVQLRHVIHLWNFQLVWLFKYIFIKTDSLHI